MAAIFEYFPTFGRWFRSLSLWQLFDYSAWKSTPPWPTDSLATKQKALLRLLGIASTDRLEAAPLIAALATEHRGSYRRRLRRLARRMTAGMSLSDAVEQTPGVLSDEQALAVRFGEQSGTLPATLQRLLEHPSPAELRVVGRFRQIGFYVAITAAIFLFIMSFFLVKIMPSFQAIFNDFSMDLPPITVLMIGLSNDLVNYWYLFVLPLLLVIWLVRSPASRRFFSRNISSRILRPIAQLRVANILSLLAGSYRAGRPLAGAISTLARYHFDPKLRHKLLFVRNEIEQGVDPWESMTTAKLISTEEANALTKSTSSETRAWTMERLADKKRGQVDRRIDFYVSLLQPAITLLLAAVVLFVAVACMTPLIKMVEALSG
jgi:type II secretory pathway component PulF